MYSIFNFCTQLNTEIKKNEILSSMQETLNAWRILSESRHFWQEVNGFANNEKDPRITPDFLKSFQGQFLAFIYVLFLKLGYWKYLQGDVKSGFNIIDFFYDTSIDLDQEKYASEFIISKLEIDIRELLNEKLTINHQPPKVFHQMISHGMQKIFQKIRFLQYISNENDATLKSIRDSAAAFYLNLINGTKYRDEYLFVQEKLLKNIMQIPVSRNLAEQAGELYDLAVQRIESGNTWFSENYFDLDTNFLNMLQKGFALYEKQKPHDCLKSLLYIKNNNFARTTDEIESLNRALCFIQNEVARIGMRIIINEGKEIREFRKYILGHALRNELKVSGCSCCDQPIQEKFYILQIENKPRMVCRGCTKYYWFDQWKTRKKIRAIIEETRQLLNQATATYPKNRITPANLNLLDQIERDIQIRLIMTSDEIVEKINNDSGSPISKTEQKPVPQINSEKKLIKNSKDCSNLNPGEATKGIKKKPESKDIWMIFIIYILCVLVLAELIYLIFS